MSSSSSCSPPCIRVDSEANFNQSISLPTVTVTEALVLRPLLEDRGRITVSLRILVPNTSYACMSPNMSSNKRITKWATRIFVVVCRNAASETRWRQMWHQMLRRRRRTQQNRKWHALSTFGRPPSWAGQTELILPEVMLMTSLYRKLSGTRWSHLHRWRHIRLAEWRVSRRWLLGGRRVW